MATIDARVRVTASVPDAIAQDPEDLTAAVLGVLASILGLAGINGAELQGFGITLDQ